MARNGEFASSIDKWIKKTKSKSRRVVGGAARDLAELMTVTQPSIRVTGRYVEGAVPVDTTELINSFQAFVNGTFTGRGRAPIENIANEVTLASDFGRSRGFIEMYFTAEHGPHVEYGTTSMGGRFFVRNAVMQWPTIMAQNVSYVRSL